MAERPATRRITENDWIIIAVGKHIVAQDALAGGGEGVGIEEAGGGGVVVAGMEVIEASFGIVAIASVS